MQAVLQPHDVNKQQELCCSLRPLRKHASEDDTSAGTFNYNIMERTHVLHGISIDGYPYHGKIDQVAIGSLLLIR